MIRVIVSFWCQKCSEDMDLEAWKSSTFDRCEYFFAYCIKCRRKLVRYITERQIDPYYRNSLKVKREKAMLASALIQPGDSRFKLYYRNQWLKMEKSAEEWERKRKKDIEDRDRLFQQSKSTGVIERENAKLLLKELYQNG